MKKYLEQRVEELELEVKLLRAKFKLEETKVNIYGEAAGEKFYNGPFLFNVLINRADQQYGEDEEGIQFNQAIDFYFLRDDLKVANVVPEVGDIILYQEGYYEVDNVNANQYFMGKNPDYPNSPQIQNPGLEKFGSSISIICETHYVPADKVGITQERLYTGNNSNPSLNG